MQKSKVNSNPKVFPIEEGKLRYPILNTETGRYESKILIRGVDVTEEEFDVLLDSYHAEQLNDRYWEEHLDYTSEMKKARYETGEEDVLHDPIESIRDERGDVLSQILHSEEQESEMVRTFLERVLPKLTESQINLIYDFYGARKTLEEIRLEEATITGKVVTHQAMSNRLKKIHARVEKLMPEFMPTEE